MARSAASLRWGTFEMNPTKSTVRPLGTVARLPCYGDRAGRLGGSRSTDIYCTDLCVSLLKVELSAPPFRTWLVFGREG